MVKLSKLYTKGGDTGETGLIGGKRVKKHDAQVHAYGELDEFNCWLGLVDASLQKELLPEDERLSYQRTLREIQQILFDIGAELATPEDSDWKPPSSVDESDVKRLEQQIDEWTSQVSELKSFLLPGGSELLSHLHLARSVCRRAERSIVALHYQHGMTLRSELLEYINRLSDWLFAFSRFMAKKTQRSEVLWDISRKRALQSPDS